MDNINFSLTGLDPVIKRLKDVAPTLRKKALRKGVREGSNIFRDAARRNAPVDSGLTKRSIVTQVSSKKDQVTGRVGVRGGGRKSKDNNPYWWRFIELGFYHKNSGQYIAANPFMRNAQSNNIEGATNKVAEAVRTELDKY